MKKFLFLMLCFAISFSQLPSEVERITLKDNSVFVGIIIKESEDQIKFKLVEGYVFDIQKSKIQSRKQEKLNLDEFINFIDIPEPKYPYLATFTSLIFPGLGQIVNRENTKASYIFGTITLSIVAVYIEPSAVDAAQYVLIGTYAYSVIDALFSSISSNNERNRKIESLLTVKPHPLEKSISITNFGIKINF